MAAAVELTYLQLRFPNLTAIRVSTEELKAEQKWQVK